MFVGKAGTLHQCLLVSQERLKAVDVSIKQGIIRSEVLDDGRVLVDVHRVIHSNGLEHGIVRRCVPNVDDHDVVQKHPIILIVAADVCNSEAVEIGLRRRRIARMFDNASKMKHTVLSLAGFLKLRYV